MKAKFITSLFVGLFLCMGLSARNDATITFTNVKNTSTGSVKEFVTFTNDASKPLYKVSYKYDDAGKMQEKVIYSWNKENGWKGCQKIEYGYSADNDQNELIKMTSAMWDNKTSDWSKDVKEVVYHQGDEAKNTETKSLS